MLVLGTASGATQMTLGFIAVRAGDLERRRRLRRD